MVGVEMGADEQINISSVQAQQRKLLQHILPHDGHWHSRWRLHRAWQTTINQNIGAVAGLHKITNEREVHLRDGCYLHQIKPLRGGTVCVHLIILSLWPNHSAYLVCMQINWRAQKVPLRAYFPVVLWSARARRWRKNVRSSSEKPCNVRAFTSSSKEVVICFSARPRSVRKMR